MPRSRNTEETRAPEKWRMPKTEEREVPEALETTGRRELVVEPDYPSADLTIFDEARETVRRIAALQKSEIDQRFERGTLKRDDYEIIINLSAEAIATGRRIRASLETSVEKLQEHPLALDLKRASLERRPGREEYLFKTVQEETLPSLLQAEERLRETAEAHAREKAAFEARRGEVKLEHDRLRREAKETIERIHRPLGLGILPKTRRANQQALDEADAILAVLDQIETLGDRSAEVLGSYRAGDELAKYRKQKEQTLERVEQRRRWQIQDRIIEPLEEKYKLLWQQEARMRSALEDSEHRVAGRTKRLLDFQKEILGLFNWLKRTGVDPAAIDDYQRKAASVERLVQEFEGFLEGEVFGPLGITEADEQRERVEPLPPEAPEVLREARERSGRNIREFVRIFYAHFLKTGKLREEISRDLLRITQEVRETAFVGVNDHFREMMKVISGGEYLPAYILPLEDRAKTATGLDALEKRKSVEKAMGFRETEHPVYGALGDQRDRDHGPAPAYGAFHLSWPLDYIRTRAVCTLGDSLNLSSVPRSLSRGPPYLGMEEEARRRQLTLEHGFIAKALLLLDKQYTQYSDNYVGFETKLGYIEVQMLRSLKVLEGSEIVLSRDGSAKELEELAAQFPRGVSGLLERIQKLAPGLRVRVGGSPHEFDQAHLAKSSSYARKKELYEQWYEELGKIGVAA